MGLIYEQVVLPLQEAAHGRWIDHARDIALRLGQGGRSLTVDMIRAECPPPADIDPRVMGSIFTRKLWESCGYIPGGRQESHGRPICVFKLKALS